VLDIATAPSAVESYNARHRPVALALAPPVLGGSAGRAHGVLLSGRF
jgi:hypothetical protein